MHGQSDALDAQALARTNEQLREQQDAISSVLRAVVRSAELQPVLSAAATTELQVPDVQLQAAKTRLDSIEQSLRAAL